MTYRGTLQGTDTTTAPELAAFIEEWTANGVTFPIQSVFLTLDSTCTVVIESLSDPECVPRSTDATTTVSPTVMDMESTETTSITISIVAGVVSGIIVIILAVAVILVILLLKRTACTRNHR